MRGGKVSIWLLLFLRTITASQADTVFRVIVGGDDIALPKKVGRQGQCEPCIGPPHVGDVITIEARADRVRRDRGAMSWILRKDLKKVYLVCRRTKEFSELPYPVNYKKYERGGPHWSIDKLLEFQLSGPGRSERKEIKQWHVDEFSGIIVNGLRRQFRLVVAVTTIAAEPGDLVIELRKLLNELEHSGHGWSRLIPFEHGVPVLWVEAEQQPETEFVYREELKEVSYSDDSTESYELPNGYRRVKYDSSCVQFR